jgi:hypothetical protein
MMVNDIAKAGVILCNEPSIHSSDWIINIAIYSLNTFIKSNSPEDTHQGTENTKHVRVVAALNELIVQWQETNQL